MIEQSAQIEKQNSTNEPVNKEMKKSMFQNVFGYESLD